MDTSSVERECSALGCLFQQIIQDMKNGAPLWEDLISKATKLHTCLKAAIVAISAYLEAFQKIADAATNARGATREIGTALTRICLRHKAVETRVKSFTSTIMDCLVIPLQEKLEDWKKTLVYLDKEHAKEYKKARTELKKTSSDTLRLQKKKTRKGLQQQQIYGTLPLGISQANITSVGSDVELGRLLESSAAIVQEKRQTLEETERKAVRAALLEERGRYCQFARFLKPVLDEEIAMLMELTHLQEVADQLQKHTASPQQLPPASEQVITDIKGRDAGQWSLATPPSSPSLSLGSRKSSMCSISSLTSSSSGSCKSHPSPSAGHPSSAWHRSAQQVSCTLPQTERTPRPSTTSTWPDLQQENACNVQYNSQDSNAANERPHTISSAYEKGHQRPALSVYTFQAPDQSGSCHSQPASPVSVSAVNAQQYNTLRLQQRKNSSGSIGRERPPIPNRCSSLERPSVPLRIDAVLDTSGTRPGPDSPRAKKLPIPAHLAKEIASHQSQLFQQPMYVNMHELASLAANRAQEMLPPPPPPPTVESDTTTTETTTETKTAEICKTESSATEANIETAREQERNNIVTISVAQRRNSLQQVSKPAPPMRRVSAIVAENYEERGVAGGQSDDIDNLPPPPAFLLEGSSPPSAAGSPASQRRSISVSETVRTLTELRHTPASPSLLRRKIAAQVHAQMQAQTSSGGDEKLSLARVSNSSGASAIVQIACCAMERASLAISNGGSLDRKLNFEQRNAAKVAASKENQHVNQGPGGVAQSFIAVLNAKLTSTSTHVSGSESVGNSPKPVRKFSIDQQHTQQQQTNRNPKASNEFLETLNAKLAEQQQQQHQPQQQLHHHHHHQQQQQQQPQQHQQRINQNSISMRSASVRRIMANRIPIIDPLQVRDSLMDQIRRGTSLRKTTGPINDRSAPKIF